jgi:hypothetical protein
MDQNSSNDTEKRNWRERLGIGAKEMPKIASEFSKPAEPVLVLPKSADKSDPSQPVVVAKPAPMAPRVPGKPATAKPSAASERAARSAQPSAAGAARPMQPGPPQSPDVLAERLRNQREAAEKLAEQRVNNAKERAEANKTAQQPVQPPTAQQAQGQRPPRPERGKPKFSFAEDDLRADAKRDPRPMPTVRPAAGTPQQARPGSQPAPAVQQPMQPQLTPARPPLGGPGDRYINPQAPPPTRAMPSGAPAASGFPPPPYRPPPAGQGYRPIDPATGYVPPPSFQMPRGTMAPPPGPRPAAVPPGMAGDPRLQSGPYIADTYAQPSAPAGGIPRYDQLGRAAPPLRNDHLRPQTHSYDGDMQDDIFEDSPKPVRRASPSDYSQAYYPDADMGYAPPRRRSGGPLLLLLLLGVAAAVGIGGVLYYQNMLKSGGSASNEPAPMVPAPDDPAKKMAEPGAVTQPNNTAAQPSKKQIYDRIVGDREILGSNVVPTEEAPVQPSVDQTTQPAAVPQPVADEPLPLPMPPPVNTQGSTGDAAQPATLPQSATAATEPVGVPPPAPGSSDTTVTATGYSNEQQQQMAAAAQQQTLIEDQAPAAAPPPEVAEEPPQAKPKAASKPKATAKAKPKKKVDTARATDLGDDPVVLVPPEDGAAITQDPVIGSDAEPPLQGATPAEQPVKKKKTLLGLFTGENKRIEQEQPSGIDAATEQQVASVNTKPKAVEPPPATQDAAAKTGFVLQLASFATEKEARTEYQRISSRAKVNGLSPIISPVSVGGSTRYRLSLGPVANSNQAQSICRDLQSAGQRDCVVKRR